MKKAWNLLLAAGVVALVAVPLLLARLSDTEKSFLGTDDKAQETIKEARPEYIRWIEPVWEPPSGEVATMLFTVQAAIGAVVLGYVIGYFRGRAARVEHADGRS